MGREIERGRETCEKWRLTDVVTGLTVHPITHGLLASGATGGLLAGKQSFWSRPVVRGWWQRYQLYPAIILSVIHVLVIVLH